MKFEDAVWKRANTYPHMYGYDSQLRARTAVIFDMFTVCGSPFIWSASGGYMLDDFNRYDEGVEIEFDTTFHGSTWDGGIPGWFAIKAPEYMDRHYTDRAYQPKLSIDRDPAPYPINSWGKGVFLPVAVQQDWLDGVLEAYHLAVRYYTTHSMVGMVPVARRIIKRIESGLRYDYDKKNFVRVT